MTHAMHKVDHWVWSSLIEILWDYGVPHTTHFTVDEEGVYIPTIVLIPKDLGNNIVRQTTYTTTIEYEKLKIVKETKYTHAITTKEIPTQHQKSELLFQHSVKKSTVKQMLRRFVR